MYLHGPGLYVSFGLIMFLVNCGLNVCFYFFFTKNKKKNDSFFHYLPKTRLNEASELVR